VSVPVQHEVRTIFASTFVKEMIMLDFAVIYAAAVPALMQVLQVAICSVVLPSYTTFGKF
jgi:hypothetical protein